MAVVAVPQRRPWPRRPTATRGFVSWLTTVDHKRIGILYGMTAFVFFIIGGIEALLMRLQLARPNGAVLDAETYNQLFTMHGVTMIFLVVMPLGAAFFNYLIPLMIGARDVAFPRLNAFSYWVFLGGGLFLYSSFLLGGAPNSGWFGYAPLSALETGPNMTFYALGLQITGIASLVAAVNFIVTIINLRAPGMSLMRMPVFVWMTLVVQFLLLFALPVLAIALFQLASDRLFGSNFFNPAMGADPILWQHLFWLFGHPEVYVLILPAMGIVSEVLPVFSRKPLFGYPAIVFAGVAIGFIGFGVWAHHMFATGLGAVANTAFGISTMIIAVPTGIKIFNWLGTMWRGAIRLTTPMLMAIGFVTMFVIGGLSGVTHAVVPADFQQTDTYYIVAHFHYVLFGGAIFGLFAGIYYWFPKFTGKMYSEGLGKLHFWMMLIGFNLTFGPMHVLGLQGMRRRIYRWPEGAGAWDFWNMAVTIGAFLIAASIVVFMVNAVRSVARGERAEADPWDARTLEWTTSSPPAPHNFDEIPTVHARDELWHRKYSEDTAGRPIPVVAGASDEHPEAGHEETGHAIHLPGPSYWPLVAALGIPLIGYGLMFHWTFAAAGLLALLSGLYGWLLEPLE
jgi:cytochrome c oxidase subunit I